MPHPSFADLHFHLQQFCPDGICLAYSGGVDSMLLLSVLGNLQRQKAFPFQALIFRSCFQTDAEISRALTDAATLGQTPAVIDCEPLLLPDMKHNPKHRCYICKKEIFQQARHYADKHGLRHLMDGTNSDDTKVFRPGRKALAEIGVHSPLAELGINKEVIRQWARELKLPAMDYPANACLMTRFPYGAEIDQQKLTQVQQAEKMLHQLGLKMVRVRCHEDIARLEVMPEDFELTLQKRAEIVAQLQKLGFRYATLDLQGFRSGSMD